MASQDRAAGPLDSREGREVVYCHACSNEWHRTERGLSCPSCGSDVTEIIDPENDPREHTHFGSASTSPEPRPFGFHDDSDPDEADIEEHIGPHGFQYRRSTRAGPDSGHHSPNHDIVLDHFARMIRGFGAPPRPGDDDFYSPRTGGAFGERHVHHTTLRTGPFGMRTATVTVFTGPARTSPRRNVYPGEGGDPFQAIFSNVIRDMGPPAGDHQPGGPPQGFSEGLQEIMSMFWPGTERAGDAVYSQEALDRIITGLMEANPQSNAAPPASENALETLDRRAVTKELLGNDSNTECSICIDALEIGQTAAFLPCKHWFHEECAVAWLKEHNTCPICRTPIERNGRSSNSTPANEGSGPANNGSTTNPRSPFGGDGSQYGWSLRPGAGSGASGSPPYLPSMPGSFSPTGSRPGSAPWTPMDGSRPSRYSRPPSQSQSRPNEAMRNLSSMQREQVRERERDGDSDRIPAYTSGYETSRVQRRDSSSPTSPRATLYNGQGARMRQRSPPPGARRGGPERDPRRQSNHGPLSWLRDRFGGSGPHQDDRQHQ